MQVSTRTEGQRAVLRLSGRFEFNSHREFREAVQMLQEGGYTEAAARLRPAVEGLVRPRRREP